MSAMCHACYSEQTASSVAHCIICRRTFCQECDRSEYTSSLNAENQCWCCKSCLKSGEALRPDGMGPYTTPSLSPALSLSSYGSCASNYGDIPAEMNPQLRGDGTEDLDTGQKHLSVGITKHLEEHAKASSLNNNDMKYYNAKTSSSGMRLPVLIRDVSSSNSLLFENHSDHVALQNDTLEGLRLVTAGDDSDGPENAVDSSRPFINNIEANLLLWIPPDPEDMEDEMESIVNDDDDGCDDYSDGTNWGQPSSFNSFDEEHENSRCYKEERQKAMVEAMNGQFKILVSRFLASEGISIYDGEDAESWLNIVASLSWEAALLVKPDVSEGRAMDPGSYIKVKCIAAGARHQSQVIKGLVFKKNTPHKHMQAKFKNPRLLLLHGSVGHSSVGLSSFNSMEQENDYLKSIIEMIETCHPNVVLVEKTVSRDIQESLMAKGITLVSDMKLPRLEKVARCTGSQIISSAGFPVRQKLKQCDSFHIEKILEEHNSYGEGSKRPIKTLMFLEGCPKPLGCTILLKGAHIDELKKVKRVMHYTVFAAYHLILETSFFADQRAFFTDTNVVGGDGISTDKRLPATSFISNHGDSRVGIAQQHSLDIPISDGLLESSVHRVTESDLDAEGSLSLPSFGHDIHFSDDCAKHITQFSDNFNSSEVLQSDVSVLQLNSGQLLSSVSASLKKFIVDRLPSHTSESISSQVSFKETDLDSQNHDIPVSLSIEALDHGDEVNSKHTQEKPGVTCNGESGVVVSDLPQNIEQCSAVASKSEKIQNNDDIGSVLDSHSILVLFSSQCITKQIFCEQSHLSRIKYYGNFDTSLGRFLQDILLNQKHSCPSCGEPPESHVYCYTHQNGNLTVLVKGLPQESYLPGEAEGKVWMWTRCLKCDHESGIPRPSRRVVMSSAARGLSFGKFLELSFSSHCASRRLSRCGHSLHRDSLRFFGLGSKVAMFRYSPVEIYAVCKPPAVLEFYSPHGQEWLKREARDVLTKGDFLFKEVAHILHSLKPRCAAFFSKSEKVSAPAKDFSEFEEMLMRDKAAFEALLLKIVNNCARSEKPEHEFQCINWLKQELLLELYVWDRRLRFILMCQDNDSSNYMSNEERPHKENDAIFCNRYVEETMAENGDASSEAHIEIPIVPEESSSSDGHQEKNNNTLEAGIEIKSAEVLVDTRIKSHDSFDVPIDELRCLTKETSVSTSKEHLTSTFDQDKCSKLPDDSFLLRNKGFEEEVTSILGHMQEDHTVSATPVALKSTEGETDLDFTIKTDEIFAQEQHPGVHISQEPHNSKLEDPEGWIWAPLSELKSMYRKDLHDGLLHKFGFINSYAPTYLSPMQDLITQGMDLLYFPVGLGCNVISVSEDDISSLIACALALSEDCYGSMNNTVEKEGEGKREAPKAIDSSGSLISDGFAASSHWSFSGSSESEGLRSSQSTASLSSDELAGSDVSFFVDRLLASDDLHPEIPIWSAKTPGKSTYSVICIHAKQFYALRRRCCSSETAYISSLSSCKKWDAQGGKSKAFFAKSMDDRFIIKQIKKTELDSFLKFAPDYFKHISLSLDSGSQTCLAKILGIYQVRQHRNGKEIKTDLMVMENLLFGRNISRTYDLKGAMFSRYVLDGNEPGKVLLDENFVEDMRISPIYIGGKTKHLLQRAIWNDTSFLTSINVMDYSLLVGVDKQRRELVFGIIDYLRQYTWDKQLETWVKASLVVPRNSLPTVISPKDYKKRFRKFMTKYFLAVPDSWSSEQCSDPCKFCVDGSSSFNLHNAIPPELPGKMCT